MAQMLNHSAPKKSEMRSWILDILSLSSIFLLFFFLFLGERPLFTPDEGRYAEIAREMIVKHDFITPYLNHIKYFEKPPLFYWLSASAIKTMGTNIFSVRCVNAFIALLGCLFTYFTVRKLYTRKAGFYASFILATSILYFIMAHMVSLDLPVTVWLTISLNAFLLGYSEKNITYSHWFYRLSAATSALAVLTKGLIGIVFPILIITVWLFFTKQLRLIKTFPLVSCFIIFLFIALPWHLLVSLKNPEFFYFYFIEQHFLRYAEEGIGHFQPIWYFIPTFIIAFFPWIFFLPQSFFQTQPSKNKNDYLFFCIWAIIIFVFFSFSKSKLIPYILPVIPPCAILVAIYFDRIASKINGNIPRKANDTVYAKTSVLTAKVKDVVPAKAGIQSPKSFMLSLFLIVISAFTLLFAYIYLHYHPHSIPSYLLNNYYLFAACLLFSIGTLISLVLTKKSIHYSINTLIITTMIFLLLFLKAIPALDNRSVLPLARVILSSEEPYEVITYNQYYQDLPFYLQKRVSILNWQNELSYGMRFQDTRDWMINDKVFWKRWRGSKKVFVVIGNDELTIFQKRYIKTKYYLAGQTINNSLISNKP